VFEYHLCFADDIDIYSVYCVQTIQYISDLGGVFGLWFGFALLAFAELFELATDLMLIGIWYLLAAIGYA